MADNYLERKMEEHRSRPTQGRQCSSPSRPAAPGRPVIDYPSMRILIVGGHTPAGLAAIRQFRALQCRVSFTAPTPTAGAPIAQQHGAMYIPGTPTQALTFLSDKQDTPAVIIHLDDTPLDLPATDILTLSPHPLHPVDPEPLARLLAFASHPSNHTLLPHLPLKSSKMLKII